MLTLEIVCTTKLLDDGLDKSDPNDPIQRSRAKFNVGPGDRDAQLVLLKLRPEQAQELQQGKRYRISFELMEAAEEEEEPAAAHA